MTHKSRKKGGRIMPTLLRRELVQRYVQLYGTANPTQIQNLINSSSKYSSVKRDTVKDDLDILEAENHQWVNDQARTAWAEKIRQMYVETNQEIMAMKDDIETIRQHNIDYYKDIEVNEESQEKLYELINQVARIKTAGKIAYINSILTEKRNFISSMMTSKPLFEKLHDLQDFYEKNKPLEVE